MIGRICSSGLKIVPIAKEGRSLEMWQLKRHQLVRCGGKVTFCKLIKFQSIAELVFPKFNRGFCKGRDCV